MKIILISTTLLGLCAAAGAAPIGIGRSMMDTGDNFQEVSRVLGLDRVAADLDFYVQSAPVSLFDTDSRDSAPRLDLVTSEDRQSAPESAPGVMLMGGLAFLGIARILRIAPLLLRRFKIERHRSRRRRVKVQLRMMA